MCGSTFAYHGPSKRRLTHTSDWKIGLNNTLWSVCVYHPTTINIWCALPPLHSYLKLTVPHSIFHFSTLFYMNWTDCSLYQVSGSNLAILFHLNASETSHFFAFLFKVSLFPIAQSTAALPYPDVTHPLHLEFQIFPSGSHLTYPKFKINKYKDSFQPQSTVKI